MMNSPIQFIKKYSVIGAMDKKWGKEKISFLSLESLQFGGRKLKQMKELHNITYHQVPEGEEKQIPPWVAIVWDSFMWEWNLRVRWT